MTVEEFSATYGYSISSIKRNFVRTKTAIEKKYSVEVIKYDRGKGIEYAIIPKRAPTMYEEKEEKVRVPFDLLKMDDWFCFVLIGIVRTQFHVFRGSLKQFLQYLDLDKRKENVDKIKKILEDYSEQNGGPFVVFKHKDKYFISIDQDFEKQQVLTLAMLKKCQEIIKNQENKKRCTKIIHLLKVWQAYRINEKKGNHLVTDRDLKQYINLSDSQLRQAKKMLKSAGVINMKREGTYDVCIGTRFWLDVLTDNDYQVTKE